MTDMHLRAVIDCTDERAVMYNDARSQTIHFGPAVYAVCLLDMLRDDGKYASFYRFIIDGITLVFSSHTVTCSLDALLDSANMSAKRSTRIAVGIMTIGKRPMEGYATRNFLSCLHSEFEKISGEKDSTPKVLFAVSSDENLYAPAAGFPDTARMHDLVMIFVREKYIRPAQGDNSVYHVLAHWQQRFRLIKPADGISAAFLKEAAFYLSSVEDLIDLGTVRSDINSIQLYMKDLVEGQSN